MDVLVWSLRKQLCTAAINNGKLPGFDFSLIAFSYKGSSGESKEYTQNLLRTGSCRAAVGAAVGGLFGGLVHAVCSFFEKLRSRLSGSQLFLKK